MSVDHVCGIAVRNPQIVDVGRHYGLTIATCVPAGPQSNRLLCELDLERHRDFAELADQIRPVTLLVGSPVIVPGD